MNRRKLLGWKAAGYAGSVLPGHPARAEGTWDKAPAAAWPGFPLKPGVVPNTDGYPLPEGATDHGNARGALMSWQQAS